MKTCNGGFFLVEALLAMAVLSVGVLALFTATSTSVKATKIGRDQFRAALLLEEKMWLLESAGQKPLSNRTEDSNLGPIGWRATHSKSGNWTQWNLSLFWGSENRELDLSAYVPT